jgi:hypothetical protein
VSSTRGAFCIVWHKRIAVDDAIHLLDQILPMAVIKIWNPDSYAGLALRPFRGNKFIDSLTSFCFSLILYDLWTITLGLSGFMPMIPGKNKNYMSKCIDHGLTYINRNNVTVTFELKCIETKF